MRGERLRCRDGGRRPRIGEFQGSGGTRVGGLCVCVGLRSDRGGSFKCLNWREGFFVSTAVGREDGALNASAVLH